MKTEATDKFKKFKEQYNAARKQMNEQAAEAFKECATDFFESFPTVNSFSFTAFDINSRSVEEYEGEELDESIVEAAEAASEFLDQFDDAIIKDLYGDHVKITVKRDGSVETEEYTDHD